MERLILARHGESEFSVRGAVNGEVAVACPLTAAGVEQARQLGAKLAPVRIDLCVTSRFERTRQTADVALAGRDVPRLVVADFDDPRYGKFEGGSLDDYRAWASSQPSKVPAPGDGESRLAIVERYAGGFRGLLERGEDSVLLVAHSLPLAYVLLALEGEAPAPRVPLVEYARPHELPAAEVERAVDLLEEWCAAPTW